MVDASTAVLGLLNDGDARHELRQQPLAVPHLIDAEIVHALRGQLRRGVMSAAEAKQALDRWSQLAVRRFALVGLVPRMWELRENLSAYDATYVALAEVLACHFVTADARIARAPGPRCPVTVVRG